MGSSPPKVSEMLSAQELSVILRSCPSLHPETVEFLLDQEVDGEAFMTFDESSLAVNFPNLIYGQRRALLKIVQQQKSCMINENEMKSIVMNENEFFGGGEELNDMAKSLGCQLLLPGYINEDGVLTIMSDSEQQDTISSISASFLKKRKPTVGQSPNKRAKTIGSSNHEEPMDIKSILNKTEAGRKVTEFIKVNGFLDNSHQVQLMRILYDNYVSDKKSPNKYYPQTEYKVAMAKGIVKDFPELIDTTGTCPWMSWYTVVRNKFQTVQASLPPSKKKNKRSVASPSTKTAPKPSPKPSPKSKLAEPSTSSTLGDTDESQKNVELQKALIRDMMPTKGNRSVISAALNATFCHRRNWISRTKPSSTDILAEYVHLGSYNGDMIAEEFARLEPLSEEFSNKFLKLSPFILRYAEITKPGAYAEATKKFGTGATSALVLLPKLLNIVLNKNTVPNAAHLAHIKKFKGVIDCIPSSAVVQVAPEGTDVESYDSLESSRNPLELAPVFPFLLWVTNDYQSGRIYLKIDRKALLAGSWSVDNPEPLIKAIEFSMKTQHVFNLEYHPYLAKNFFEYIEHLCGLRPQPVNSVVKFISAIRQLSISNSN